MVVEVKTVKVTDDNNNVLVSKEVLKPKLQTMDDYLRHSEQTLLLFFNNRFEEAIERAQMYSNQSIYHHVAMTGISLIELILTMSKVQMAKQIEKTKHSMVWIESRRCPKSYKNFVVRPDYDLYTDENCHAELGFAYSNLVVGALTALSDESVYGIINAGYKVNQAYRTLNECAEILTIRKKWESKLSRDSFESLVLAGQGSFEMMLSFFPSKLAKLLEYIGFASNQHHAMINLHRAATLEGTMGYYVASFLLNAYYGFATCFYGIGEMNVPFMKQTAEKWSKVAKDGALFKLGFGALEMSQGNFEKAIEIFQSSIDSQDRWPQIHFVCYWSKAWCYSFMGDWHSAAENIRVLKDGCKWAPSLFTYMYSMFLSIEHSELINRKGENEEEQNKIDLRIQELAKEINTNLALIPSLKRKLGGIHVFHEELSLSKSKKYLNNLSNWHLPPYELFYVWNFFYMIRSRPELLEKILTTVENYDKNLVLDEKKKKSNNDILCYITFIKAVCNRHLKREAKAIQLFEEVLAYEGKLRNEKHLIPQAHYELAMLHRDRLDKRMAKKHFKKVRSDYSGYFTESMITYRIDMMMDMYRREKPKKI